MTGLEPWVQVFGTIITPIVVALGGLMLALHGANVKRYEHLHECLHRMDGRIIRLETRLTRRRDTAQEEASQ
jgi:hypothetical protein